MSSQQDEFLFKRELYRLVQEYKRCKAEEIRQAIKKDILLLKKVINN
ncbi:hypothetical protein ACFW1J_07135 [Priestia aryabhattai]|jgi:hypothetical protein|uniref:Uncharacterized protein n=1 Tax=Priestia aryabhattai TaxID=412384 RepID=A0ABD7WQI5_PRIAR|nr:MULTISPECIES: hypothetical protein [Priestia]MBX4159547.1 hypothetical protein [Priestia megaterium]MBX9967524.1 hypothetical protein [Priestia aryabhattai]MBY0027896.1 hypothetical protein [Priestia aryabhattai]MBZ6486988.1 hypothetical protein [Priestia aryabhattai]MCM3252145.1 hypothetical protein [Priestia aryabhattai]